VTARLRDGAYCLESVMPLLLSAAAASSAFRLAVPGAERRHVTRWWPLAALAAWVLAIAVRFAAGEDPVVDTGIKCLWRIGVLTAIPLTVLVVMLRRAAPHKTRWTGSLAFLAASALATAASQLICPKDGALHIIMWHIAPAAGIGGMGAVLGRKLFSY
jgi:hypothetical protein